MRFSFAFVLIIAFVMIGNLDGREEPVDITGQPETAFRRQIGKVVMIRGRFSVHGKFGAYVASRRGIVDIVPPRVDVFVWDPKRFGPLQDRQVVATGVLHFESFPPPTANEFGPIARPDDHYYFRLEQCSIRRASR